MSNFPPCYEYNKDRYTLGGRQFIDRFKVGLFVPMHFVASGFESAWRFKEYADEKNVPFWKISREGDSIETDSPKRCSRIG